MTPAWSPKIEDTITEVRIGVASGSSTVKANMKVLVMIN